MRKIYFILSAVLYLTFCFSGSLKAQKAKGSVTKVETKQWLEMMQDPMVNFEAARNVFYNYWQGRNDYKGNGYKVFRRWEYINEFRVLSGGKLQSPSYVTNEYVKYMSETAQSKSLAGNWTLVGPSGYPLNATTQPTGMGRVNAIAFHPTDAAILYAGSPSGGFWKSSNGGSSWENLSGHLPRLGVSSILVNPVNPSILYIGTGDRDAADAPGLGVYKSTDGGLNWMQINSTMGNVTVGAMLMHPSDPNTILAATKGGIYKTSNGGNTWSLKQAGDFRDIQFKPGDPTIVYATYFGSGDSRFYRSANTGDTWTRISSENSTGARMVIGVTPADPSRVYLLKISGTNATFSRICRSDDSGLTFSIVSQTQYTNILGRDCTGDLTSQALYDMCISVDPSNADIIYVGGINLWKSTDGGAGWNIITHWVGSNYGENCAPSVHADHHWLGWSPLNGALFTGHDGGISYTANGGSSWTEITSNMQISQIYKIGQSCTQPDLVVCGLQDNGSAVYDGSNFTTVLGGDGMECVIDPLNPAYRYVSTYDGNIYRSSGGGYAVILNAFWGLSQYSSWVTPLTIHKTDPNTMFVGLQDVYRSNNIKTTSPSQVAWSALSNSETGTCKVIEQSAADVNILYIVRSGQIKRTDNANAASASVTWTSCTLPGGQTPVDLESHPTNADIIYAAAGYKVYKSIDKGVTWSDISVNLPALFINCLVYDKNSNEGLYAGNQTGVWFKDANMPAWTLFSDGLPPADIRELEIYYDASVPSNNRIKAATYGRGLWQSDLMNYAVIDPSNITATPFSTSRNDLAWSPNSNNDNIILAWSADGIFGTPVNGTSYSAGNNITGGGTVLCSGSFSAFNHTSLTAGTEYYYRIWSTDDLLNYSPGTMISAATLCNAFTPPLNESFDGSSVPPCWRVADNEGNNEVWAFGTYTSGVVPALNGNYAYLHSATWGAGNSQNTDLISPTIDLSSYTNVSMSFTHFFRCVSGNTASVYYSINNGATWTLINSYTATTANPETVQFSLPALVGQSQVRFKWNYTGTNGYYWSIDDVQVTNCTGIWTGATNTSWHTATNWCNNAVPTSTSDVYIPAGVSNMPLISISNAACKNITIASGASLSLTSGSVKELAVSGDWFNYGTFTAGIGSVNFNGTNDLQTLGGTSTSSFNILKVTKGAQTRILDVTGPIALTAAANPLTLTSGTFRLSNACNITPFTSAYTIVAAAGFWNNGGTVTTGNLTWTVSGLLRNSAGTLNIGTTSTNCVTYNTGSFINIDGGAVNISGRLSPSGAATTTYTQTGGTLTICTVGSTSSSLAPFDISATGSSFTWSGGNIVIPKASSFTSDFKNLASIQSVTGGTLQIGNESSLSNPIIRINSSVPIFNLNVFATGEPSAQIITNNLTIKNDVTILGGALWATVNLNVGGNWTNNGSFSWGTSRVTFNGSAAQNITGTAATQFYDLALNNSHGLLLSGNVNATVRNSLYLTSGVINTGNNKIILNLTTSSVSRTAGHIFGTLQKRLATGTSYAKTFEIGDSVEVAYTPVTITFDSLKTGGDLSASTISTDHQQIGTSDLFSDLSINRHWLFTASGIVFNKYNATFNFLSDDADNNVNITSLICGKYSGSWTYPTMGNISSGSFQITGETAFSDFQAAERAKVNVSGDGNWSNPNTWLPVGVPIYTDNISIKSPSTISVDITDAVCNRLIIQSGAVLNINSNASLEVKEILSNLSGISGLILNSDVSGTASLLHKSDNVNATVEKYLPDNSVSGWSISSPLTNASYSTFSSALGLYGYNSQDASWLSVSSGTLEPLKGYITKFGNGDGNNNTTVNYSGALNNGNLISSTLYRTGYQNGNYGWNLLGNPYPSTIDWDLVVGSDNQAFINNYNVNPAIYIKKAGGSIATYLANMGIGLNDGSQYIAPMQAFWVQVYGNSGQPVGTGTLNLSNNMRTNTSVNMLKKGIQGDALILTLSDGQEKDDMLLRFNSNGSENYNPCSDVVKMFPEDNQFPLIYTVLPTNEALACHHLPTLTSGKSIPLTIQAPHQGVYTISLSESETPSQKVTAVLEDTYTLLFTDLSGQHTFSFTTNEGYYDDRFILHLSPLSSTPQQEADKTVNIFSAGNDIYILNPENTTLTVNLYDMPGRLVHKETLSGKSLHKIHPSAEQGCYIIEVTGSQGCTKQKVFLQ